ncbi:unnamed protein product [Protopolystoma xenopodis]|uniref:Uncharacterized protein n=1 Tax=Protopolystoma xenopodis TaxID=117903 RepID=A0A448XQU1_9PLAT|nr:unnamed protein product [Protopolystoma xenopodis]
MHAVVHLSKTIILPFSYPLSEEDLQTEANMVFTLGERASRQTYILKVDATDNKLEITSSHSPSLKSRSTNSVRPLLALQYNELMAMYGRDRYTNDCILVASLEGNVIYEFLTFQSKKQMEKLISILVKVKEFQQATSIADSPGNMRPKPDQFFGRSKKQTASTKLFPILRNTYMPRISQMSRCRIANTRRLVYAASTHSALETDIDGLSQSWQNDDKQALWIDGEGEESFHQVNDWLFIHCVCLLLIREFFPGQLSPGSSVESEMTTNLTSNTVSSLSLETVYQTLSKIMEEDCFSRPNSEKSRPAASDG